MYLLIFLEQRINYGSELKNFNSMEKKLLFSIIFLGAAFIFGSVFCLPEFQEMRSAQSQLELKTKELEQKKSYYQEIDILSEKLEQYPDELDVIDFALPDDFSLPFLFDFFEKIASKNGLFLKNINQTSGGRSGAVGGSAAGNGAVSSIQDSSTNLSLSGTYSSFKNFLFAIEKSARLVEVEKVSFSLPKNAAEASLDFNVTVKTNSY